jgi:hypothetical protein
MKVNHCRKNFLALDQKVRFDLSRDTPPFLVNLDANNISR